jgi:hypothetical protein
VCEGRGVRDPVRQGPYGLRAAQRWASRAPLADSIDRGEQEHETALKTNASSQAAPAASRAGHVGPGAAVATGDDAPASGTTDL